MRICPNLQKPPLASKILAVCLSCSTIQIKCNMFLLQFDGCIFKTRSSKYKETLTTYIMFDDYDRQAVTEIGNKNC